MIEEGLLIMFIFLWEKTHQLLVGSDQFMMRTLNQWMSGKGSCYRLPFGIRSIRPLIEKLVVDLETGERGFLIAGKEEFLEPYESGIKELSALIKETSSEAHNM